MAKNLAGAMAATCLGAGVVASTLLSKCPATVSGVPPHCESGESLKPSPLLTAPSTARYFIPPVAVAAAPELGAPALG